MTRHFEDERRLKKVHFLVPGPIDTLTGGFIYDRKMVEVLRIDGMLGTLIELDGPYPLGDEELRRRAETALEALPSGGLLIIDGLAYTALDPVLDRTRSHSKIIVLVHHLLGDETGLRKEVSEKLLTAETRALRKASGIITTSSTTKNRLLTLDNSVRHLKSIYPGVEQIAPHPVPRKQDNGAPCSLLSVGILVPRKGHDLLINALAGLEDLPWRLTIVGEARDKDYARLLQQQISDAGLADRITLSGMSSDAELQEHYRSADLFVLASRHEGFGIALAEAVSYGLPILSTTAGAIPEAVPEEARLLVPPDDVPALQTALRQLLEDGASLATVRAGAEQAAQSVRNWTDAQSEFIDLVKELV